LQLPVINSTKPLNNANIKSFEQIAAEAGNISTGAVAKSFALTLAAAG